jgi:hypothetical protein
MHPAKLEGIRPAVTCMERLFDAHPLRQVGRLPSVDQLSSLQVDRMAIWGVRPLTAPYMELPSLAFRANGGPGGCPPLKLVRLRIQPRPRSRMPGSTCDMSSHGAHRFNASYVRATASTGGVAEVCRHYQDLAAKFLDHRCCLLQTFGRAGSDPNLGPLAG